MGGLVKRTTSYSPTVAEIAENLLDALRAARRSTTKPASDLPTQHIAKAILRNDRRQFACHHIAAILVDAFNRGAPEEDVQGFAEELKAEIHFLYTQRDGTTPEPLPEAHQAEEHAEGIAEEAELAYVYQPSAPTFFRLQEAKQAHFNASMKLLETARQQALRGIHS
jgi:hypothetical protein